MNKVFLSIVFILIGALVIFINNPLKPFDSGVEGPLVYLFEFAGPSVFILGVSIFGYQLANYIKEKEWPDVIPNTFLVYAIVVGLLASIVLLVYRINA